MAAKHIQDLLDLPTRINKGDFVLNLAARVAELNAARSQRRYGWFDRLTSVGEIVSSW